VLTQGKSSIKTTFLKP